MFTESTREFLVDLASKKQDFSLILIVSIICTDSGDQNSSSMDSARHLKGRRRTCCL